MWAFKAPEGIKYTVVQRSAVQGGQYDGHVLESDWRPHNRSEADEVIFGRDLDHSNASAPLALPAEMGPAPADAAQNHAIFGLGHRAQMASGTYADHGTAGVGYGGNRHGTYAGHNRSGADSVIFGRDLDDSDYE
eukprot:2728458-Prymnesium_polylepis.2